MKIIDKDMKELILKTVIGIVSGTSFYLYRLSKIPNCLFRNDSKNEKKLNLGAIESGLLGPIKTLYLSLKYNDFKNSLLVFRELFLTANNPILIFFIIFIILFFI